MVYKAEELEMHFNKSSVGHSKCMSLVNGYKTFIFYTEFTRYIFVYLHFRENDVAKNIKLDLK